MPNPLIGVAAASVAGSLIQGNAAKKAAAAQGRAAELGIEEQRRQFDLVQQLMKPYVEAGTPALQAQQAMLGLGPAGSEQAQIDAVRRSPAFQSMLRQGEESILQRASATGGLRGGNIQAALAQFSPQLLAQELETRYNRFGGMTQLGQNAAAGVGTAGMATGTNVANLLGQQGAARAGGIVGQAKAWSDALNTPMRMYGMQMGAGGGGAGGGAGGGFGTIFG